MHFVFKRISIHNLVILLVALLVGTVVIGKTFILSDCLPFDSNDDANHTFVNLHAAQLAINQGSIPLINLFNNFGTPLLGDALTYPFAVQALTYYFFDGPVALAINRYLVAVLSILALYVFFLRWQSRPTAIFSSCLVYFSPPIIWFSAHHHYQMTLLFFVLNLLFQFRLRDQKLDKTGVMLWILIAVLTILSVSINLVIFALPFFALTQIFLSDFRIDRRLVLFVGVWISAILVTLPQNAAFFLAISESTRIDGGYGNGSYPLFDLFKMFLAAPLPPYRYDHLDTALYIPFIVLFMSVGGFVSTLENASHRKIGYMIGAMGLLPIGLVYILAANSELWAAIPLLKSVDVTRLLWFAYVFVFLAAGIFLDKLRLATGLHRPFVLFWIVTAVVYSFIYHQQIKDYWNNYFLSQRSYAWAFWLFSTALIPFLIFEVLGRPEFRALIRGFLVPSMVLGIFYPAYSTLGYFRPEFCRSTHHFSMRGADRFEPASFLAAMTPGARLATALPSIYGHDLRAIYGGVLGSNGRSIVQNRVFTTGLLDKGIIIPDKVRPLTYHFGPDTSVDVLRGLGIRYFIAPKPRLDLENAGWSLLASEKNVKIVDMSDVGDLYLYQSLEPITPVYLVAAGDKPAIEFQQNLKVSGNAVDVELPRIEGQSYLIAAFSSAYGWRATIDGKTRALIPREDNLLSVDVSPGDRLVRFEYAPFTYRFILLCFLLGIAGSFFTVRLSNRNSLAS